HSRSSGLTSCNPLAASTSPAATPIICHGGWMLPRARQTAWPRQSTKHECFTLPYSIPRLFLDLWASFADNAIGPEPARGASHSPHRRGRSWIGDGDLDRSPSAYSRLHWHCRRSPPTPTTSAPPRCSSYCVVPAR